MKKLSLLCVLILLFGFAGFATAAPIEGSFVNDIVYIYDPSDTSDESDTDSMIGVPDGYFVDLDGGAATFTFSQEIVSFDYDNSITAPEEADLVIPSPGGFNPTNKYFISFGYGTSVDSNGDGFAENAIGTSSASTLYISHVNLTSNPSWSVGWNGNVGISFFDLNKDVNFTGFTNDFFLTIDDYVDLDIDAIQILRSEPIPEPSTIILFVFGIMGGVVIRKRLKA